MRLLLTALALAAATLTGFAQTKEITIKAGDETLALQVPKDATVKTKGDKTSIIAQRVQVYVWALPEAKTVAAAVPKAADVIKSEFVKFTVKSTENVKVAGHEAKLLKGSGEEADDNDPGTADVVFFTTGKTVFAACVHGEHDDAEKQRPELMKVLASIKAQGK